MKVTATLHTSLGDIRLSLFTNQAPKTTRNFVGLAEGTKDYTEPNAQGTDAGPFYDGSLIHRVVGGAIVQGGDPTGTGRGGPGYRFPDEFSAELLFDRPFRLAMANSGPGTNGSQFFITVAPLPKLNFKHTVFGEVADQASRDVVTEISKVATEGERPAADVVIHKVTVEREG